MSFAFLHYSFTTTLLWTFTTSAEGAWTRSLLWSAGLALAALAGTHLAVRVLPWRSGRVAGGLAVRLAVVTYAVVSVLDFFSFVYLDQRLSVATIFVLAETNVSESVEYLKAYGDAKLLLLAAFLLFPMAVARGPRRLRLAAARGYTAALVVCFVTAGALPAVGSSSVPVLTFVDAIRAYRIELAGYRKVESSLAAPDVGPCRSLTPPAPTLAVLVLGESTSRNHMSLYGYERPTSPRLEAMRDQLLVFGDVISPHSHTMPALKKLFTFANSESETPWYELPILMDLYETAGYRTYWISNQEMYGVWSNSTTVIANRADVRVFHETVASQQALTSRRVDEELLPHLDRILRRDRAGRRFLVIHLKGAHTFYRYRYPDAFAQFESGGPSPGAPSFLTPQKQAVIDEYDNAVLYGDQVVAEIIERVKREAVHAWVLFLSDHAEEVYDQRDFAGHKETLGSRYMVEIPFVLWLSDAYESAHPEAVASLRANLERPYMTDDAIHTILDLSSVRCEGWEASRSLASVDFDATRPRYYGGWDYDRELRRDASARLIRRNRHKIWAHRANSIGKLKRAAMDFAGVELDLVFQHVGDGWFDVNHPPTKSIGLSLDDYLGSITRPSQIRYWLDLKNLTDGNHELVARRLRELLARHGLTSDTVIIESRNFGALAHLSAAGFQTSYYLPILELGSMTDQQLEASAAELAENARTSRARWVSCPGTMLGFARDRLLPRLEGVALLTWFPQMDPDRAEDARLLQGVVDDTRVDVVLVGYRTAFDR